MADPVTLNSLVEALAGAVIEAQHRIENHHYKNIMWYFDEDKRPKTVNIKLPNMDPDGQGYVEHQIPWLALVPHSSLKIKDVEIDFEVELGDLKGGSNGQAPRMRAPDRLADMDDADKDLPRVSVDVRSGLLSRQSTKAHVKLRVEGGDAPDGTARLLHHLVKLV